MKLSRSEYNLWYVELERKHGDSLIMHKEGPFLKADVECLWERVDDLMSLYATYLILDGARYELVRIVDEKNKQEGDYLEKVEQAQS